MKRCFVLISVLGLMACLSAAELAVTPYTVIAQVTSFESYRAVGGGRYSLSSPYGNESTIVATILQPESLAGREIAIPFESRRDGKELLVQRGTRFRFDHPRNLADLRARTDWVRRRAISFPENGIVALKADGQPGESYAGIFTPLK